MSEESHIEVSVYPNGPSSFCWSVRVPFSNDGVAIIKDFIALMEKHGKISKEGESKRK